MLQRDKKKDDLHSILEYKVVSFSYTHTHDLTALLPEPYTRRMKQDYMERVLEYRPIQAKGFYLHRKQKSHFVQRSA
jgi:hypothetical protein